MFLLTAKLPKRTVINLGTVLMSLGMFMVGCSDILGAANDADLVLGGLCCCGLAAAMIAIPIMPEMLESIEAHPEFGYDPEEVTNEVSNMFVVCIGLGESIAPITASVLLTMYGFTET